MFSLKTFTAALVGFALAFSVPLLQGCGCRTIDCLCADGSTASNSCSTGSEEFRCPEICSGRGGWSGTCSPAGTADRLCFEGGYSSLTGDFAFPTRAPVIGATQQTDAGNDYRSIEIDIASFNLRRTNRCSGGEALPNGEFIAVSVEKSDGTALSAKKYTVADGGDAIVRLGTTRSGAIQYSASAVSGTVSLDQINLNLVQGSFDVQLELNDGGLSQLSGVFESRTKCN